jgi:hypothetical protein
MAPKLRIWHTVARAYVHNDADVDRLTFGTISALFGLENHIISQAQYTVLVTVVILSAVVPTLIAERFFMPETDVEAASEKRALPPVRAANE